MTHPPEGARERILQLDSSGLAPSEIARALNVSRQRVHQILGPRRKKANPEEVSRVDYDAVYPCIRRGEGVTLCAVLRTDMALLAMLLGLEDWKGLPDDAADLFKELLGYAGSQTQAAAWLGVRPPTFARYLRGTLPPQPVLILAGMTALAKRLCNRKPTEPVCPAPPAVPVTVTPLPGPPPGSADTTT